MSKEAYKMINDMIDGGLLYEAKFRPEDTEYTVIAHWNGGAYWSVGETVKRSGVEGLQRIFDNSKRNVLRNVEAMVYRRGKNLSGMNLDLSVHKDWVVKTNGSLSFGIRFEYKGVSVFNGYKNGPDKETIIPHGNEERLEKEVHDWILHALDDELTLVQSLSAARSMFMVDKDVVFREDQLFAIEHLEEFEKFLNYKQGELARYNYAWLHDRGTVAEFQDMWNVTHGEEPRLRR